MSELRWAPPTRADNAAWQDLIDALEAVDCRGEVYTSEDLDDQWSSVWSDPERAAVFVWDGDELVAFSWLKVMPGRREAHKAILWGGVRPSHRRRGIGTELLRWQVEAASTALAGLDPAFRSELNLDTMPHDTDLRKLADGHGFEPVRTFLELARPMWLPVAPMAVPEGLEVVPFRPELDEATREAHTEAFADHWGSEPRTADEWRQWFTGHRGFRPDLSRVAIDRASGDVAGYVLVATYPADWDIVPVEAWINTVGTRPAWRGRGVGAALLTEVLDAVAADEAGFERAILGVDSENPTGAVRLYRRLGFEDVRVVTTLGRGPLG
jgi:ribosomal protein S18 acetylase RimI-like enzyme